jgi:glycosyltransferase involved in cell wall biosynthesis
LTRRQTLSLLIPAYNAAWCLPRLLKSANAQTIPFDEIWVYDDCSTDDTAAVAEAHSAKVLRGDVNKGCSAGKNALARHVETDWVHFHDADDELLPNFVELARKWMDRGDKDIVLFSYEWRDNDTGQLLARSSFNHEALVADARRYAITTQINPFCGLYRRTKMLEAGGYDEDPLVLYNEDVAFHIRMAFAGLSFAADGETSLINYRVGGSMSAANQAKCALAQYHVMRKTLDLSSAQVYRSIIAANLWDIAGRLAAQNEFPIAAECVNLARRNSLPPASSGKLYFRLLAWFSPILAIHIREMAIRRFKPQLRVHLQKTNTPVGA